MPEVLTKLVDSNLMKKTYDDLLQPGVQQVGKTLGTVTSVINTILAPVERYNLSSAAKTERFKQDLQKKYEQIPPDKVVEPSINIIARSLEAIKYNLDETEIRELFLNLITSSMNKDKISLIHPSFVNKISEMSAYDAIIFREINERTVNSVVKARIQDPRDTKFLNGTKHLTYICSSGVDIFQYVTNIPSAKNFENIAIINMSIQNLISLGLLSVSYSSNLTNEQLYLPYDTLYDWDDCLTLAKESFSDTKEIENFILALIPGILKLTPLGESFAAICLD